MTSRKIKRNGKFNTKAYFSRKKTKEELLEWITQCIRELENETNHDL